MHTPEGFHPAHTPPGDLPPTALAFAFRDAKVAVGGDERTPTIPALARFEAAGVRGPRHYLGELAGVPWREAEIAELLAE